MVEINYGPLADSMEALSDEEAKHLVQWLRACLHDDGAELPLTARQRLVLGALNVTLTSFIARRAVQWYDTMRDVGGDPDAEPPA